MAKFLAFLLIFNFCYSNYSNASTLNGKIILKNSKGELENSDIETTLIYIAPLKNNQKFSISKLVPKMEQKDKAFIPLVMPILVNSTVEFNNLDPYMHNVFSTSETKSFDLGLYKLGDKGKKIKFDKKGIVNIYCNIHEQMLGFIVVLDNPYFSMANKNGEYSLNLEKIPPGKIRVVAWHRFSGQQIQEVDLKSNEIKNINFELTKNENVDMDKLKLLN